MKQVMVDIDGEIIKVPYSGLAVKVEKESDDQDVVKLRGNIVSKFRDGDILCLLASIPYYISDIRFGGYDVGRIGSDKYRMVYQIFKEKYGKFRVRNRLGFQIFVKYDLKTKVVYKDSVKIRSTIGNAEVLLPNLYNETGKVCWGRDPLPDFGSVDDIPSGLLNVYFTAPFNGDLRDKSCKRQNIMRYFENCKRRVENLGNWSTFEKSALLEWLTELLTKCQEVSSAAIAVNVYNLLLLSTIFGDDYGALSAELAVNKIKMHD